MQVKKAAVSLLLATMIGAGAYSGVSAFGLGDLLGGAAVSYTHLTLPTICSV